jgi:hypothetical protein
MSPEDPEDEELAELDEDEPDDDPDEGWIADTWRDQVQRALGRRTRALPEWMARPAMHREAFTTPASLSPFVEKKKRKAYAEDLKPFNFALRAQIAAGGEGKGIEPGQARLLAPYERDPQKWLQLDWADEYSGTHTRITTGDRLHPSMTVVESMKDVVRAYGRHPESKSLGPDGEPCREDTAGPLPVLAARRGICDIMGVAEASLKLARRRPKMGSAFSSAYRTPSTVKISERCALPI